MKLSTTSTAMDWMWILKLVIAILVVLVSLTWYSPVFHNLCKDVCRRCVRRMWSDKDKNPPRSRSISAPKPAKERKIGLAIVIANEYDGISNKKLRGVRQDKERWEEVFKELEFDVRTSREAGLNANKEEMLELCKLPNEIQIRQEDIPTYQYIAFVFSGHGCEGFIISQDNMELNLETEVFPNLFGKDKFVKLIFIDACRQFIGRGEPTEGDLKLYVQKAMGNPTVKYRPDPSQAREYAFISYATLPGHSVEDTFDGSEFSKSFTKWL